MNRIARVAARFGSLIAFVPALLVAQSGPGGGSDKGSGSNSKGGGPGPGRVAEEIRVQREAMREARDANQDRGGQGGGQGGGGAQGGGRGRLQRLDPEQRRAVEQRLQERFGSVVRNQLNLDDQQFQRLRETNREFEGQRRDLVRRERATRLSVRDELQRTDASADNAKVGEQMQEMLKLQRAKLDLIEQEDKALGEFLSPTQRAKYFALQEVLRRRVEEIRLRVLRGEGIATP